MRLYSWDYTINYNEKATSKTWTGPWTRTMKNLDLEKSEPRKTWVLKNLDLEKPGPKNTWTLKSLDPKKARKQLNVEKWLEDHIY